MRGKTFARASALGLVVSIGIAFTPQRAEASFLSSLLSLLRGGSSSRATPVVTGALTLQPGTEDELRDLMSALWARIQPGVKQSLSAALAAQAGQKHGNFKIEQLNVTTFDIARAPSIHITPNASNGQYTGERVEVQLPGDAGGWALSIAGRIGYDVSVNLGFTRLSTTLHEDIGIDVTRLRVVDDIDIDASDPGAPSIAAVHHPALDYDLSIHTQQALVNTVLSVLKPVIHLVLSYELDKVLKQIDPLLASVQGKPGTPWGSGGPAFTPFGQTPDLEKAALMASEDIQHDHTPFGPVYQATFSDPVYRQGTVVSWDGLGDSPIWTGSYLAGEAFRFAQTGDNNAQVNAKKVVDGIKLLLDVQDPNSGRLSRYAVPLSSAFGKTLGPASGTQWIATLNGQQYFCEEDISRDQHDGVMMGLSVAYDYFTDPSLKAECATLIQRVVDFLESTGWNALRRDNSVSAPFVQSPCAIIAYTAAAERTDPAKYGAMRKKHGRIASFDWLGTWMSTLDPMDSYYKWNLGHTTFLTAMRLETDPDRYRALERSFTIMRRAVGHHRNPWFDGVEATLDPAARSRIGPVVTDDLYRMVSRGRRDRTMLNSQDPTIEQAQYKGFLQLPGGNVSILGQGVPLGTQNPITCAKYPIPVEKRPFSDWEWQRNPFDLDGGGDPHHQAPGADIVTPYWMGRYNHYVN